jgi:single-strand DNA-binding protein
LKTSSQPSKLKAGAATATQNFYSRGCEGDVMLNDSPAIIEGFVTHDPQFKKTKTGKSVCTFSLAINHYSKNETASRVSFIDIETWEKIAEICSKNIRKGKRIMVIGSIKQDWWEDDKEKMQSRLKIIGNEIRVLEPLNGGNENANKK